MPGTGISGPSTYGRALIGDRAEGAGYLVRVMIQETNGQSATPARTCAGTWLYAPRSRVPRRPAFSATLFVCLAALFIGCAPAESPPAEEQSAPSSGTAASTTPEAVYHTALTFVGFGPEPSLVHLRFQNRTEPDLLRLDYTGWVPGPDSWTSVLGVVDSIPVPRAAWRVIPAGPLRVGVEDGGELSTLILDLDGGPVQIDALEEISSWSGSTGQRESLRFADLQAGGRVEGGWLLQRQRARLLDEPAPERLIQAFLLADTLGNGLLILRDRAFAEAPATVWAWLDGVQLDWSDAVLLDLPGSTGLPGFWSFEVPDVGLFGEITGSEPLLDELPEGGIGFRLYRATGTIGFGDERRSLAGIGVEERGP